MNQQQPSKQVDHLDNITTNAFKFNSPLAQKDTQKVCQQHQKMLTDQYQKSVGQKKPSSLTQLTQRSRAEIFQVIYHLQNQQLLLQNKLKDWKGKKQQDETYRQIVEYHENKLLLINQSISTKTQQYQIIAFQNQSLENENKILLSQLEQLQKQIKIKEKQRNLIQMQDQSNKSESQSVFSRFLLDLNNGIQNIEQNLIDQCILRVIEQ